MTRSHRLASYISRPKTNGRKNVNTRCLICRVVGYSHSLNCKKGSGAYASLNSREWELVPVVSFSILKPLSCRVDFDKLAGGTENKSKATLVSVGRWPVNEPRARTYRRKLAFSRKPSALGSFFFFTSFSGRDTVARAKDIFEEAEIPEHGEWAKVTSLSN